MLLGMKMACDIPLESSGQGLQLWFVFHINRRFAHKVMGPQSCGSFDFGNFGTPIWSPRTKCHLDAGPMARHRVYYMGEGGGFPQIRAMVSLVSQSLLVTRPSTKSVPIMH
jgi:hypothetical protein